MRSFSNSSDHDRLSTLWAATEVERNCLCCLPKTPRSLTVTVSCGRQVSARKLKPHPPRPRSLHERLLEDIKAERKLRPVSPDMIRRSRLGTCRGVNVLQAFRCNHNNQWSDTILSPASALYEPKHLIEFKNHQPSSLSTTSIMVSLTTLSLYWSNQVKV